MIRTTVYLPEELKRRVARTAQERGISEAEVIRSALDAHTTRELPRPRLPLVRNAGRTNVAERVDDVLADGFGHR